MSFDYNVGNLPDPKEEPEQFMMKVREELDKIQRSAAGASNYIQFKPLSAEPSRRYEEMLVYADGDNWDPGDGPGLYMWDSQPTTSDPAEWNKVGKIPSLNFRPTLSAHTDWYVNTTTGSDSTGDGTVSLPWKTIAKAVTTAYGYDLNGFTITVNLSDGTYNEVVQFPKPFIGMGAVVLKGNTTTPSNVVVGSSTGNGVIATGPGVYAYLNGMRVISGSGGTSVLSQYGALVVCDKVDFGTNGGVQAYALWGGVVNLLTGCTVSAGATTAFILSQMNGIVLVSANITMSGTLTFGQVLYPLYGGIIWMNGTITGGTITGLRYRIHGMGILILQGNSTSGSSSVIQDGVVDTLLYVNGVASSNIVMKNVSVDLAVGYTQTSFGNGSKSSTWTPAYANGNFQDFTATGSHAVGVPTGHGTMVLDWVNSGAVTVSFSGYTKQNGDAITSTSGHKFRAFISTGAQGSLVSINALQ